MKVPNSSFLLPEGTRNVILIKGDFWVGGLSKRRYWIDKPTNLMYSGVVIVNTDTNNRPTGCNIGVEITAMAGAIHEVIGSGTDTYYYSSTKLCEPNASDLFFFDYLWSRPHRTRSMDDTSLVETLKPTVIAMQSNQYSNQIPFFGFTNPGQDGGKYMSPTQQPTQERKERMNGKRLYIERLGK